MRFLSVLLAILISFPSIACANNDGFASQYVKPLTIKTFSKNDQGVIREESLRCTPQTCCFSERFYCFMEEGKCICDLHVCEQWPDAAATKSYWMEFRGTEAEKYCGRSHLLHELTDLCLCDPDKDPPCAECNRPAGGWSGNPNSAVPSDCRY